MPEFSWTAATYRVCGWASASGIIPKLKSWQLQTDGKARLSRAARSLCPPFPFCFVDLFIFGFYTIKSLLSSRVWRDLDIIWRRQRMRGTAWDRTPQACCRGPARAGCQEWLRGPSGTSLRHLTSALQLSPALTLSRLKTHMELRQERASGTWSITLCHIIRISPIRIFYNSFSITWRGRWLTRSESCCLCCHMFAVN